MVQNVKIWNGSESHIPGMVKKFKYGWMVKSKKTKILEWSIMKKIWNSKKLQNS